MSKRFIVAALLAGAAPFAAAAAQERDLDRETPVGQVFAGQIDEGGEPALFLLSLQGGQAIDLTAAQVAGSDPAVRVVDAETGELLAENDDSAGTLASNVRLFSETPRRVRIEVRNASVDDSSAAMRFDLVLRPTEYRPKPVRDLVMGGSYEGTLDRSDEQLFRLTGERGQAWTFTAVAGEDSGLDPAIDVYAGTRAAGEPAGTDDDGGGGLNSRLRFTVPEDGPYIVRVYSIGQSEGAFVLTAAQTAAVAAPALEDIALGTPVTGTIDADVPARLYRLDAAARAALAAEPGPLIVEMSFTGAADDALDPIVAVGFETPLGFSTALSDDDGGGETNARLTVDASMLTDAWLDSFRIRASGYLETAGGYELTVRRAEEEE